MMKAYLPVCLLALAWPLTATGQSETGTPTPENEPAVEAETPDPIELARATALFLASQPAMSFDWFVSFDEVVEGREKITHVRSGSNVIDREKGFYSRTERGDNVRDYYYDGTTFTVVGPDEGFYSSGSFDKGFDTLIDVASERTDKPLVVWSIMSPTLGEDRGQEFDGAAYLGTTIFAGEVAHHLAFSEYDEDWQIFISTDPERPVPLLIVSTDPYSKGWPQYHAYFMNWDLEPEIAEGAFTYQPAEDDVPITMPGLQALLEAGQSQD